MAQIVFIDRDGVINVDLIGDYIKSWDQFKFENGALEALEEISKLGIEIIIISNQAGIGDGLYPESALRDIDQKMLEVLRNRHVKVRSTHYCLHGKDDGCSCRKPEIGLFKEAVKGLNYNPSQTYFIGDKATDVEAGKRFGVRTIFVRTGHGKLDEPKLTDTLKPDHIVNNLRDAVPLLKK